MVSRVNPKPSTLNPKPSTLNPTPYTPSNQPHPTRRYASDNAYEIGLVKAAQSPEAKSPEDRQAMSTFCQKFRVRAAV